MNGLRLAIGLGVVAVMTGCATAGTFQTASTVGEDNFQFGAEPSIVGVSSGGESGFIPMVSISGRYGLSDTTEIGGRLGPGGIDLLTKFQFTDPDSDGTIVSLAPSIGGLVVGGSGGSGGVVNVVVPLLVGFQVGDKNEFVLGPKVVDSIAFGSSGGSSATLNVVSVGTTVGYSAQVGKKLKLLPEFGLLYPVVGSASASSGSESASESSSIGGGVTWQAGVGFLIGQTR